MEENKKVNFLTIVLLILLLIAVGVIAYLIGSNNAKENNLNSNEIKEEKKQDTEVNNEIKEENKQDTEVNNEITPVAYTPKCIDLSAQESTLLTDIDATRYKNVFEYIDAQDNVKILINYCKYDENDPNADNGFVNGNYELTEKEKETVMNEMKKSSVEIASSGIGGACVSSLEITYERKNKQYYVSYYQFFAMTSNDGNIYKIIDKTVNNTLKEPQYCLYNFNNLSSTAISIENRLTGN